MSDEVADEPTSAVLEQLLKRERVSVLGVLTRYIRDLDLAEDMLQDAVLSALDAWPRTGVPAEPRAWLLRTARNRAIDSFRRASNFAIKRDQLALLHELSDRYANISSDADVPDERLRLISLCCHPALPEADRIALTLRSVCGLGTAEIARGFLCTHATMSQRLVRAKRTLRDSGVSFDLPDADELPERLASMLAVIYLIFNEGYSSTAHEETIRVDLCDEALYLAGALLQVLPEEPEVHGLNALLHFHDSRRNARYDSQGVLQMLHEQDRSLWDHTRITAGERLFAEAIAGGRVGIYTLQAAVSREHARAASAEDTDWRAIAALYGHLYTLNPTVVIKLNRAVAVSFSEGPQAGLDLMPTSDKQLDAYQPYQAAMADMHARAGHIEQAEMYYVRALVLTSNAAEREYLERQRQRRSCPPGETVSRRHCKNA